MIASTRLLACLLLPLSLGLAKAGENDMKDNVGGLLQFCKDTDGSPRRLICLGYVSGIGDMMLEMSADELPAEAKVLAMCGSVRNRAMVQAFVNWAEKHPEHWEKPRKFGVIVALRELWPCK